MKQRTKIFVITLMLALVAGCDHAIESAYHEQVVVGAFLYAGSPVDSVFLHRTTPFGSYYNDWDYAIDSAQVTISVDGVPHMLKERSKGCYYLPALDMIVEGGKTYSISITAPNWQTGGQHHLTAMTTVPMPIHFTSIADSIRGKTFLVDTNNLSTLVFLVTANVTDASDHRFLLSVTAVDTTFGRVQRHRINPADSAELLTRYSQLQTGPAVAVTPELLRWYGPNRITMYAIDTNWWDYQRQVSNFGAGADYQVSLNHISGGIGIFGSAARDTVTVMLKPKQ